VDLPGLPARLQQQFYQACDLEMIYRQHLNQVTINVTITATTADDIAAPAGRRNRQTARKQRPPLGLFTAPYFTHRTLHDHGIGACRSGWWRLG